MREERDQRGERRDEDKEKEKEIRVMGEHERR